MDKIEAVLKDKSLALRFFRLSCDGRWMSWFNDEWVVRGRAYGEKHSTTFYRGDSIDDALEALVEE